MQWFWPGSPSKQSPHHNHEPRHPSQDDAASPSTSTTAAHTTPPPPPLTPQDPRSTLTNLTLADFTQPTTLITTAICTTALLYSFRLYRRHLKPYRAIHQIPATHYRHRSLFGYVASVGDADNFRLYHTPGGILAGFTWLRVLPSARKALFAKTIHIRLAGIDAPELAHFGKPAQPHAEDALAWLKGRLEGRRVRCVLHRRDQYGRAVATVWLRRVGWLPAVKNGWVGQWLSRDIGFEMLQAGWATVYEAKYGSEFGGREVEYKEAEKKAKRDGNGIWGGRRDAETSLWRKLAVWLGMKKKKDKVAFESPREYKTRMAKEDAEGKAHKP